MADNKEGSLASSLYKYQRMYWEKSLSILAYKSALLAFCWMRSE